MDNFALFKVDPGYDFISPFRLDLERAGSKWRGSAAYLEPEQTLPGWVWMNDPKRTFFGFRVYESRHYPRNY